MFTYGAIMGLLVCGVLQGRVSISSATVNNADSVDKTAFHISGWSLVYLLTVMLSGPHNCNKTKIKVK